MSETGKRLTPERKATERLGARLLMVVVAALIVVKLFPVLWDKMSPFIIAVPLAALLQPVIRFLQEKIKMKRGVSSLLLVLLVLLILVGMLVWGLSFGISQVGELVSNSPEMISDLVAMIRKGTDTLIQTMNNISPQAEQWIRKGINDVITQLTTLGADLAGKAVTLSVSLAAGMPYMIIYISFLAMGLFFIAKDYPEIRSWLPGGKRRRQDSSTTQLTNSAIRSLIGYLKVQGTFALIVLVVSVIALKAFGFRYAVALAILAGIMELIPMIGSGLLYFVLCIVYFLAGETAAGFEILGLTLALQLLRRVLEPKLMSNNIGITPLQSLIGMFVGMRFGGILGLIGGPVLMAVLVGAMHGGFATGTMEDTRTIANYLRRRWNKDEEVLPEETDGTGGGDAATETETELGNESTNQEEKHPAAPAGDTGSAGGNDGGSVG